MWHDKTFYFWKNEWRENTDNKLPMLDVMNILNVKIKYYSIGQYGLRLVKHQLLFPWVLVLIYQHKENLEFVIIPRKPFIVLLVKHIFYTCLTKLSCKECYASNRTFSFNDWSKIWNFPMKATTVSLRKDPTNNVPFSWDKIT